MEDQQPDSGDLTTDDEAVASSGDTLEEAPQQRRRRFFRRRTVAAPAEETPAADDQPKTPVGKKARAARSAEPTKTADGETGAETDIETEAGTDIETEAEAPAEVVLVPHRPAGARAIGVAVAASVLFVGGSAFAGAMVQPYLAQRALNTTKIEIARTATAAITALWTYTPDDMPTLADRASKFLSGDFANDYRKYIDAIVEPNKQAQVTNTTEVVGAAVESVSPASTPTEATALVYTNSVATSPVTKNIPSLRYLSYRLTMTRHGGQWLITRMSTITSFDLTPKL
ncbi:mammalian cell entry protein [Mycolicibacterium rufum]|uniref:Mammalian cell entry protein n=1 Tax=Mycolicibacterium rufum TaxID=318424 RepID=A0ABY3UIY2_9MYCO|nr:hypothetical protein [Mycolicibacterium rufum]KGI70546.1 mammalian cell entry protein [Mycolicibacterium rufum]ULP37008.1 mammalian cell entry protein [Mycolicibacterium rufum]